MARTAAVVLCTMLLLGACTRKFGEVKPEESIFADTMVDMTWQEVKEASDQHAIVILPVAIIEEHGPHMDLSPDIYETCLFCRYIKHALERDGTRVVLAPPFYWGISEVTKHIPGTFSVRPETLQAMLHDIAASLKSWGFTTMFSVNLHGDPVHNGVIEHSMNAIRKELGMDAYNVQTMNANIPDPVTYLPTRNDAYLPDYHAGAVETAIMNAFYPGRVRTQVAKKLSPEATFDPLGYVGDPSSYGLEGNSVRNAQLQAEQGARMIRAFLKAAKPETNE